MNILNPAFRWVPSHLTNIRVTFERERQRIAEERRRQETPHLVLPINVKRNANG